MSLPTGELVAERFRIEGPLGSGGMGAVFLASDRLHDARVAIKVLELTSADAAERFRREARLLGALSHPGIVRYVAHGETPGRRPFLAMELLEGEDLGARLTRGALSVAESLSLARRVAEALTFAHAQGIVHRDIKPSNLFLVAREVERVKVLDFGIARAALQPGALTQTGAVLGTVGYMAPEQAMGARDVDGRADVFALGCVLFECLTGRPAFAGHHAIAVLAKVLSDEAPRLAELRPELEGPLDELLSKMLAKKREERPSDLEALAEQLQALRLLAPRGPSPRSSAPPSTLGHVEQRLVSVILAQPGERAAHTATRTPEQQGEEVETLQELAQATGVELVALEGGALLLVVTGAGAASDQAMRAASTALRLKRLAPDLRVALATGRAEVTGRLPLGPAIDRAAALLQRTGDEALHDAQVGPSTEGVRAEEGGPHHAEGGPSDAEGGPSEGEGRGEGGSATAALRAESAVEGVYLDEVTQGLLAPRFVVRRVGTRSVLVEEQEPLELEAPRLLLGKRTPTVGRERELSNMEAMLTECVGEGLARAMLVTAPPGTGKSRLSAELVGRVRARGDTRLLFARAESSSAGSSLALTRRLLASALGTLGKAAGAARLLLRAHVAESYSPDKASVMTEFLAELLGLQLEEPPSPLLRAARSDGMVMQEQKRRAFEAFMDAQVPQGPLLVVLEDLHWADTPSLRYLEEALARHAHASLMVLGLARPEVRESWPRLWEAAEVQELRLGALSRKAAERLARAVLGEQADAALIGTIIGRAEGNAFYLEELLRRVAEGDTTLPETVLAMAQSRLEKLEPEARRLLRAASVYGEACWPGALVALAGTELDVSAWLETLADREVLARAQPSRFAGEREYRFRHALLRDAAYATLRDAERPEAHARAGGWLEEAGEQDALLLAEHFERGGQTERATYWLRRAVALAYDGGEPARAVALTRRALALEPTGPLRGELLALGSVAIAVLSDSALALAWAREALTLLAAGGTPWWSAVGTLIYVLGTSGDQAAAGEIVMVALTTSPGDALTGPYGQALCGIVGGLAMLGQSAMATPLLAPFETLDPGDPRCEPTFLGWLDGARSNAALFWDGSGPWRADHALRAAERSTLAMEACGQLSGASFAWFFAASILYFVGRYDEALRAAERAFAFARRSDTHLMLSFASSYAAASRCRLGDPRGALERLAAFDGPQDPLGLMFSSWIRADALLHAGEPARAIEEAFVVLEHPASASLGAAMTSRAHLALGDAEACLRAAETPGAEVLPAILIDLHTSRALALYALGREQEARAALTEARDLLVRIAEGIEDLQVRKDWLTRVEECVRTRELVRDWFGEVL